MRRDVWVWLYGAWHRGQTWYSLEADREFCSVERREGRSMQWTEQIVVTPDLRMRPRAKL